MGNQGDLTVAKAKERLDILAREHAELLARVDQARRRIHEFAPGTREYEMVEKGLSLHDIDQEFYSVCANTSDPQALASRMGVDPSTVTEWARQAVADRQYRVIRLVVAKNEQRAGYAMGFGAGKQARAEELMGDFKQTLIKHGWTVELFGPDTSADPSDTLIADA